MTLWHQSEVAQIHLNHFQTQSPKYMLARSVSAKPQMSSKWTFVSFSLFRLNFLFPKTLCCSFDPLWKQLVLLPQMLFCFGDPGWTSTTCKTRVTWWKQTQSKCKENIRLTWGMKLSEVHYRFLHSWTSNKARTQALKKYKKIYLWPY